MQNICIIVLLLFNFQGLKKMIYDDFNDLARAEELLFAANESLEQANKAIKTAIAALKALEVSGTTGNIIEMKIDQLIEVSDEVDNVMNDDSLYDLFMKLQARDDEVSDEKWINELKNDYYESLGLKKND
jgi:hypothetical protein